MKEGMGGEGDHQQQHEGSEEPTGVGNASAPTIIHIWCTTRSKFSVDTFLEAKVGAFKVLLAEKCDIPADQQRLIYKGRILKDDSSLQSYGTFPFSLFLYRNNLHRTPT